MKRRPKVTIKYSFDCDNNKGISRPFAYKIFLTYKRKFYFLKSRFMAFCSIEEEQRFKDLDLSEIDNVLSSINGDQEILLNSHQEELKRIIELEKRHVEDLFDFFIDGKIDTVDNFSATYNYSLQFFKEYFETELKKELASVFNTYFKSNFRFDLQSKWEEYYGWFNRFVVFSCTMIPSEDRIKILQSFAEINKMQGFLDSDSEEFGTKGPTLISYLNSKLRSEFLKKWEESGLTDKPDLICSLADDLVIDTKQKLIKLINH